MTLEKMPDDVRKSVEMRVKMLEELDDMLERFQVVYGFPPMGIIPIRLLVMNYLTTLPDADTINAYIDKIMDKNIDL
jgi:hypothetical protein